MRKFTLFLCIALLVVLSIVLLSACNSSESKYDFKNDTYGYSFNSDGKDTVTLSMLIDKKLENAIIPKTVAYKDKTYTVTQIGEAAFAPEPEGVTLKKIFKYDSSLDEKNKYLKTVTFENGSEVHTINGRAFEKCKELESITFPEKLEVIKGFAFNKCISLNEVSIPKNIALLDDYCFENCLNLKSVVLLSDNPEKLPKIGTAVFKWFDKSKTKLFGSKDVYPIIDELEITLTSEEMLQAFSAQKTSTTIGLRNWNDYVECMVVGGA